MLKDLLVKKYNLPEDQCQIYFDFLKSCQCPEETQYYEKHHILPVSLFPELKRNKLNIMKMLPRDHFLAHYHLAKITRTPEMIFAFNQMKRVLLKFKPHLDDYDELSLLYEEFREELSIYLSKINTGNKMTDENKKRMSESMKGMVIVKYEDGTTKRIETTHPDYLSGIAKQVHTGTKRSETGRANLKEANSPDKKGYPHYNLSTNEVKYFHIGHAPLGWVRGNPNKPEGKPGAKWYHDPDTMTRGRFYDDEIPNGWVKGRGEVEKNIFKIPVYFDPINGKTIFVQKQEDIPKFAHNLAAKKYYFCNDPEKGKYFTPRRKAAKNIEYEIEIKYADFNDKIFDDYKWLY